MLRELVIRDFAIIGRLTLEFGQGLSCLTGETGAGKSILVDAISALLGGKAGAEALRTGADSAIVEGAFSVKGHKAVEARLKELGLDQDGELILRRVISPGRGKVYINGSLANMATLQEIGDLLVDIHGQHEHQSLLNVGSHLGLLDSFCSLTEDVSIYGALYSKFSDLSREAAEIREGERDRARRLDLLLFQKDEISQAALSPGEEGNLVAERARLVHADRLRGVAASVLAMLSDSDTSALAQVGEAVKGVREIAALVPEQSCLVDLAGSAEISLREACSSLRAFNDSVEEDPERLEEVAGRLDLISRLKKKYGETVEDIIRFGESLDTEIAAIENTGKDLSGIEGMIRDTEAGMTAAAARLTAARNKGASGLSKRVEAELSALGMGKVRFDVRLTPLTAPGPRGCEKAEFLISANPGEAPKPLSKVASGGELSRVMLAIKVVLSSVDELPTLIFDEVDSGVGGETATSVGKKLREAAAGRQVLCITHLPQIASMADEHFMVEKTASGDRTEVAVRKLSRRERVDEIARMLGGAGLKTASAHAEELVRQGGAF